MAVSVDGSGDDFQHSAPEHLFTTTAPEERTADCTYDVAADGQSFLIVEPAKDANSLALTLVTDWLSVAKK